MTGTYVLLPVHAWSSCGLRELIMMVQSRLSCYKISFHTGGRRCRISIHVTLFVVFSHGAIALLNCPQYEGGLSAVLYGSLRSLYALCSGGPNEMHEGGGNNGGDESRSPGQHCEQHARWWTLSAGPGDSRPHPKMALWHNYASESHLQSRSTLWLPAGAIMGCLYK